MASTLGIEHPKARGEVVIEVRCRAELGGCKAVVIVREAVGNDQVGPAADPDPIGPVVGIAVGIVKEAAVLDEQCAGVRARRIAALPAKRAAARCLFDSSDGPRDDLPLVVLALQEVADKAVAVAAEV